MKYLRNKILVLLCFLAVGSYAQDTLVLKKSVPFKALMVEIDNIGNIYTISSNEISKWDKEGNFILKNSSQVYGNISSLDASNALKMILFFRDLSQISYIDNLLSQRGDRIELDVLGFYQTTAVCRSYNDGFWLFDQTTFELTRFTEQLEITAQSGNLAQILGEVPSPVYMREYNNFVYMLDEDKGVRVFDWYGSYVKTIPLIKGSKFVIRSERLFVMNENNLESYDLKTGKWGIMDLPVKNVIDFSLWNDQLVLLTENQLLLYEIHVE